MKKSIVFFIVIVIASLLAFYPQVQFAQSGPNYPPTCLSVDPISLEATWCEPLITAMDEDFEDPIFPPAGWQIIPDEDGWLRTDSGSIGGWIIPDWDSYYAVTYDEFDGCCDYLVAPPVDLTESEGYILSFDSFYNGSYGVLAFLEYSTDSCETWEVLQQLMPAAEWTYQEIDLGAFDGPTGVSQIWFAFRTTNGGWGSGWAIDNVKIQVPYPPADYLDFYVYLDDELVGTTTETTWNFAPMDYGLSHTAGVKAHYADGLSEGDYYDFTSEYLIPPDSLTAIAPDDAAVLSWYPPSDTCCPPSGQLPEGLLGYNLYKNQEFLTYTPHTPPGVYTQQGFVDELNIPGWYEYTVTAVYDLTPYGYPGDTAESVPDGPAVISSYFCFELDFLETWDLGSFEENYWSPGGDNWSINGQEGQPVPAAEFTWDPIQEDYSIALESFPITAVGMTEGIIWLDYDLKLESFQQTGLEMLDVEIWNWDSEVWSTVAGYSNFEGSFDWTMEHLNIKAHAMGKVFKIRFLAHGANSLDILSWFIDNIHIYRKCEAPYDLIAGQSTGSVILEWTSLFGPGVPDWIHWDDGINSGNNFGTGLPVEFDCAARWEPEMMISWEGAFISQIAFFPAESDATYNVRVWKGEDAAEILADQVVISPVIGEWNMVTLNYPVLIDISQELWIGYHVNSQGGYPAGVDDGPAIEGYGNMINLGGWQTLQEVNPEYDVNWNISAHLESEYELRWFSGYNIYRSTEYEEYALLDYTTETTYIDDELPGPDMYCYKVTAIWESETDICESDFTNDACLWVGIDNPDPDAGFNIYPNPASDYLFIDLGQTSSDMDFTVSLYNSSGFLLFSTKYKNDGGMMKLDIKDYPSGIYCIRLDTHKVKSTKFIKL
jgi:hypothetical protein